MDSVFGYLMQRMSEENLSGSFNVILLSDHGMATIKSKSDQILVNNFIDINTIDNHKSIFYGEVSNIYPANKELVKLVFLIMNFKLIKM